MRDPRSRVRRPAIGDAKKAAIIALHMDNPAMTSIEIGLRLDVSETTVCHVRVAAFGRRTTNNYADHDTIAEVDRATSKALDRQEGARERILAGNPMPGDKAELLGCGLLYWGHKGQTLVMA